MQTRGARLTVVALLVVISTAAAVLAWDVDRQIRVLDRVEGDIAARVDQIVAAAGDVGLAQHGYLTLGEAAGAQEQLVVSRLQQIDDRLGSLRALRRTTATSSNLEAASEALANTADADARAREYATAGQTFVASELLFGANRDSLTALVSALQEFRRAETDAIESDRTRLWQQQAITFGSVALLWFAGLLLLARTPASQPGLPTAEPLVVAPAPEVAAATSAPSIDLAAAAAVCADLCRVTTTAALPELLGRAAEVLNARGLIVWMGAGDQLFAAASYGYDARVVSRLGPISRSSVNATATAWRTGELRSIAGDQASNGGIVVPLFNPSHCFGVLAAEIRDGREEDAPTQAVAALIAAQLASAVAAWPAASTGSSESFDRAAG